MLRDAGHLIKTPDYPIGSVSVIAEVTTQTDDVIIFSGNSELLQFVKINVTEIYVADA